MEVKTNSTHTDYRAENFTISIDDTENKKRFIEGFSNIKKFAECAIGYTEIKRGDLLLQMRDEILNELCKMMLLWE